MKTSLVYDTHKEVSLHEIQQSKKQTYFRDLNCSVNFFRSSVHIIMLDGAMKVGKKCVYYSLRTWGCDNSCALYNYINYITCYKGISELVRLLEIHEWAEPKVEGGEIREFFYSGFEDSGKTISFQFHRQEKKGVRVFSPFATVPELKKPPKKWNKTHLVKVLKNKQFEEVFRYKCFDGMQDMCVYKRGEISNIDELVAEAMTEDWNISIDSDGLLRYFDAAIGYKIKLKDNLIA